MAPPRKFNSLASWRNAENSLHSINLTMPYQLRDSLSFMRFLGLGLEDRVPDAKTVWLYREHLAQAGVNARVRCRVPSDKMRDTRHLSLS